MVFVVLIGILQTPTEAKTKERNIQTTTENIFPNEIPKSMKIEYKKAVTEINYGGSPIGTSAWYQDEYGQTQPAYCIDPYRKGVSSSLANYDVSITGANTDPVIAGILLSGYPNKSAEELGLSTVDEAYASTKGAAWASLANSPYPNLNLWNSPNPKVKEVMLEIIKAGKNYGQVNLALYSMAKSDYTKTEDYTEQSYFPEANYDIISYQVKLKGDYPSGTKILNKDGNEQGVFTNDEPFTVHIPTKNLPENSSGNVQTDIMVKLKSEVVLVGTPLISERVQRYDIPKVPQLVKLTTSTPYQTFATDTPSPNDLKIIKKEAGTTTGLAGAVFEVKDPKGKLIGTFQTNSDGEVNIAVPAQGKYSVTEIVPPSGYQLDTNNHKDIIIETGTTAELTFSNHKNHELESIQWQSALEYKDQMKEINLGVLDNQFVDHEDINVDRLLPNPTKLAIDQMGYPNGHGNSISSVMGAKTGNETGLSGIAWKSKLFGISFDHQTNLAYNKLKNPTGHDLKVASSGVALLSVTKFLENDVRIINFSMGDGSYMLTNVADEHTITDSWELASKSLATGLDRCIRKGEEFLIVQASGNNSHIEHAKDLPDKKTGWVDFKWNGYFGFIENQNVKDRVIVAGAHTVDNEVWEHTQVGTRVDLLAPGHKIFMADTDSRYTTNSGTSFAAPHVAGVAGMVWSIDENLTGADVKKIIVNTADRPINTTINGESSGTYNILNAKRAVEMVAQNHSSEIGTLTGAIYDPDGLNKGAIKDAHVLLYKLNDGNNMSQVSYECYTNKDGRFEFNAPESTYIMLAKKDGYMPLNMIVDIDAEVVNDLGILYMNDTLLLTREDISGVIVDSLTGKPLENVEVKFRSGWNVKEGYYIAWAAEEIMDITDAQGNYDAKLLHGYYTMEMKKDGYITGYQNIVSTVEPLPQNGSLTSVMGEEQYRIVLTWGSIPRDLDSHLTGDTKSSSSRFHVYYASKEVMDGSEKHANLDLDDTSSYGPETVTIYTPNNGLYRYSVHDYTNRSSNNSQALSLSGAKVQIYKGGGLVQDFFVPADNTGTLWTVFEIDNGTVRTVNTLTNVSSPGSVRTISDLELFENLPDKE